jgi:iron complex outermembrane receptor protein
MPDYCSSSEAYLTEGDLLTDVPLVITASRLLQTPSRAPASVTVIDREMIDASTALEIPDLLRLVPGFQVSYPNGNIASVTYHGNEDAWSNRMQVLIDGRSVYSPLFSIVDWTHLDVDMDDIERIEVIRGPNAPVYGSNSFVSTINIITKQPFQDGGITARVTAGSQETLQEVFHYSENLGNLDYRITLSHHQDEGFDGVNDNKSLNSFSTRLVYDSTPKDSVDMQLGMTQGPEGAWGQSPITSPDRDKDTQSHFFYTRWKHVLSATSDFHVQVYSNYLDWSDTYRIGPLSSLFGVDPALVPLVFNGQPDQLLSLSRYDGTGRRKDIEMQHTLIPGANWRLVWGISYRVDTLQSFQILGTAEPRNDYSRRLFANAEWRAYDPLTLNAGAMIEENGIVGTYISPRFAANYEVFTNQTLRAVASRSLRSPSIYENFEYNAVRFGDGTVLDVQYVANGDLEAEVLDSYEIGYRAIYPTAKIEFDLKSYQEHMGSIISHPRDPGYPDMISPLLSSDQSTGSFVRVNNGYVDIWGAEIQLVYRPSHRTLFSLQYSYAEASGRIIRIIQGGQPVRYNENIDEGTPTHTLSLLTSHVFSEGLQSSLEYFYVSAMEWGGDGSSLPSCRRLDVKISKNFSFDSVAGKISLIMQNALDDEYMEFQVQNIFDRRAYLQLNMKL